ncbi:MAG: cbb3-type cytochrome oxidase assembly protein CcoS [Kiritimatiellae bacterium]|nr:cbb3-type cytochrome oxidase assembly protein CcoS [Kiritimatiellia bacterium]MCO5060700.1 cbb3-type cytochrome oxidase assembly protein CcoS [Kiritimatiellia bacterium]MCO6399939.1 cbb3-type cytochrome oxidase assembly protein CcoS [Verrucomicrobiota bacterium]
MSVLFLLMGASFVLAVGFLLGFIWAVRRGQFEDTETPTLRLLTEDGGVKGNPLKEKKEPHE